MSNKEMDRFYVYQPYGINENNGYLWGIGCPSKRFNNGIETYIKGLSREEAQKICDILNERLVMFDNQVKGE